MNQEEQDLYADFIMAMRQRGVQEHGDDYIAENKAAENYYGKKYVAIRADFNQRVHDRLNDTNNKSVQDRLP